jgi:hypothetical protein
MYLEEQQITGIRFIKKASGKVFPPSMLPENARILPGFQWRGEERLYSVEDLFKGKPVPILPTITGIPLPKDVGQFFENLPEDEIQLPEESKLSPKDLQNRPDDPQPETLESEAKRDSIQQKINESVPKVNDSIQNNDQ